MGIVEVLTIVLATLKWLGVITLTWGQVFTPMAIVYGIIAIIYIVMSVGRAILERD